MKGGSESGAVALFRPTLISLLKEFLIRIILNCLSEALEVLLELPEAVPPQRG
jgi:hypothetical protein